VQEELSRPFDTVKAQISSKLFREKRTKEFDDLVKRLKEEAKITVDEKELEAIQVAAAPAPGAPGAPGMPGMPGMPGNVPAPPAGAPGHGAMPAPTPVAPAAKP